MESQIKLENKKLVYAQEDYFFRCQICGLIPFIGIDYQNKKIYIEKKCENNHISKTEINTYLKSLNSFKFKCFNCDKQKNDLYFWPEINKFFCNSCKQNNPEKCINIKKIDSICQKSFIDFSCYCLKCEKNQCIYCNCNHEKEKRYYNSCIINSNEVQFFKNNLSKAKELLKRIERVSLTLSNQIHEKLSCLEKSIDEFKEKNNSLILLCEKIIKCYENHVSTKNINYQVIHNVRNVLNFKLNLKSSTSIHEHIDIIKNFLILENSKLNIELKVYKDSKLNNPHFQNKNSKIKNNNNLNNKNIDSLYLKHFLNNNNNDISYKISIPIVNSKVQTSNSYNFDLNSQQSKCQETISPLIYNFFEKEVNKKNLFSSQEQKNLNNESINNRCFTFKFDKKKNNLFKSYDKNLEIQNYFLSFETKKTNENSNNKNEEEFFDTNTTKESNKLNQNILNSISSLEELRNEYQNNNSEIPETIENEIKKLNLIKEKEIESQNSNINSIIDKEIEKINLIKEKEQSQTLLSDFQTESQTNNIKIKETIEKEIEKLNLIKEKEKTDKNIIKVVTKNNINENMNNPLDKINETKEKSAETISITSESGSELLENKIKMIQLKKPKIKIENKKKVEIPKEKKKNIFKISKTQNYQDLLLKEIFEKYPTVNEKDKNISIVYNYLYDDNSFYSGEMNMLTKEREGRGILIDPDGSYRIGYFHKDNQEKYGIWHYVDKLFYYEGEFYNDLQQGYGECYWDNGDCFFGLFHNSDLINGDYHYNNGTIYRGAFKNGKKNGIGQVFDPVKNIWEDKEFKNDILIDNKKRGGK